MNFRAPFLSGERNVLRAQPVANLQSSIIFTFLHRALRIVGAAMHFRIDTPHKTEKPLEWPPYLKEHDLVLPSFVDFVKIQGWCQLASTRLGVLLMQSVFLPRFFAANYERNTFLVSVKIYLNRAAEGAPRHI